MDYSNEDAANIAEVIVRETRKPTVLLTHETTDDSISHVAVPTGFKLETLDPERFSSHPRYKTGFATLTETGSFLDFVKRHRTEETVVWVHFNPESSELKFIAVIDDHGSNFAGWRSMGAAFEPPQSVEWKRWSSQNGKAMDQLPFAEWIERNQDDIASVDGLPTSLQMLQMATQFEIASEKRLKSHARLQSGGVALEFVDRDDAETVQRMSVFDTFALGIPVFRGAQAYQLTAKLRYRARDGKVNFTYELLRADKTVEHASMQLIAQVRAGLEEISTPLLMGNFTGATKRPT